jgi:hypothetical protein
LSGLKIGIHVVCRVASCKSFSTPAELRSSG